MKKRKLYVQTLVAMLLLMCVFLSSKIDNPVWNLHHEKAKSIIMDELTMEEVSAVWSKVTLFAAETPSKVVSLITAVNESSKYGAPIDEKSSTRIKQVHSSAGGMVVKSGKNDTYGLYIQIQHEDAVSTYGNLTSISVVEAERVQRGEIIGSYDSFSEKEFYYELQPNL